MKFTTRRLSPALAAAVLPLALLGFAPSAQAAEVGHFQLDPTAGTSTTILDIDTLVKCPAGSAYVSVEMFGTGINPDSGDNILTGTTDINPGNTPDNEYGGFHLSVSKKFFDVFQAYNITAPAGDYTLKVVCRDNSAIATDEITGTVRFSATSGGFNASYVQLSNATATSTVLAAGTPDPVISGTGTSLTATVTPSDAVGTITFKNGGTNLAAPVAVVGGTATLAGATLPAGTNSLSAVFTPTSANNFQASTGTTSFAVAGPTSITGTARVGSVLTCAATTGGTKTYAWFRDGVQASYSTSTVTAPASWLNAPITCRVTSTKGVTSVTRLSAARTVTAGVAPVAKVKPKVVGTTRVARTLTCSAGTWSPAATSYRYQWFRGAAKLAGKTARTYRTVAADRNKMVSCQVTAVRTGHLNGVAKAPARKVT